jgi:heme-degrading monooxygenase HmoA
MWEYLVTPERVSVFERAYGPSGDWIRLFRRAAGYVRTELHRDRSKPNRFITVDYWESESAFHTFRSRFSKEFEALDAKCEELTTLERELGRFWLVE